MTMRKQIKVSLTNHCDHIKKYNAKVKSAVFLSSLQSPAISKRSKTIIRSPVSNSFGRSLRRKPTALASSRLGGFLWCAFRCWWGQGRFGTGGGSGGHSGSGIGVGFGRGVGCRQSGIRLRRNEPSGCGTYRLYMGSHLPDWSGLEFRKTVANWAIFAARMAFSSFPIRPGLR